MQSKEPELRDGKDFNPPYPTEQPGKKVNKMPLADLCSISQTMAGLSSRPDTHIKVRFAGKNF